MYISLENGCLRRALMRRCLLMLVLAFLHISDTVRQRFPMLDDIVHYLKVGLMTLEEKCHFEALLTDISPFWVPGARFVSTLRDASARGMLLDAVGAKLVMKEFLEFRSKCGLLRNYNWITIPRNYGQVVKLAVYSFSGACLIGRQCVDSPGGQACFIDRVIPVWTVLEFLFYVGLLRVAGHTENPFSEDDEDFDLNFLIDRHVTAMRLDIDYLKRRLPDPRGRSAVVVERVRREELPGGSSNRRCRGSPVPYRENHQSLS